MACVYIVPVLPQVMAIAGYDPVKVVQITAAMLALANTVSAFVTNLPFILSPSVPISLFIAIYLFDNKGTVHDGSVATIWSGVLLCILGSKPFAIIFLRLVPYCLQASLTSAIGILVALSGTTEIHWVVAGKHSLLDMGELTPAIYIGLGTIILMGTVFHYKIKGAFVIGLIFGSVVYWAYANAWPQQIASVPSSIRELQIFDFNSVSLPLTFASFGLLFTLLVGLTRSYSDLAHLTDENDHVPRGRLIFVLCGLFTIVSGLNSGLPIALSSEVAVGLKDGAKTGLSTLIAAFCYFLLIFIGPLFAAIPPSGTFPLLFLIGVFLLPNLRKVDWSVMNDALPAFFIIFVVPFTQNLLRGMLFGFIVYGILAVLSGQMKDYIYIYFHEVKHEMRLLFCAKDEERTSNADSDEPPPQRQSQENSEPPAAAHNNSAADIQIPRDLFVGDLSSESMAMRH